MRGIEEQAFLRRAAHPYPFQGDLARGRPDTDTANRLMSYFLVPTRVLRGSAYENTKLPTTFNLQKSLSSFIISCTAVSSVLSFITITAFNRLKYFVSASTHFFLCCQLFQFNEFKSFPRSDIVAVGY